jgi:hypothetical protein
MNIAIPGPPFKGTFQIRDTVSHAGWSESLWLNTPDFNVSLTVVRELAALRVALLPERYRLDRIRASNPKLPRAGPADEPKRHGSYKGDGTAHRQTTTLRLRLQGGGYQTPYNLGGVPGDVGNAAGPNPTEAWQAAFDLFVAALRKHCVMVCQPRRQREPRQDNIAAVAQGQWNRVDITLTADTFAPEQIGRSLSVRISGTEAKRLNGTRIIIPVDATHCYTNKPIAVPPEVKPVGRLTLPREPIMVTIEQVLAEKLAIRKRGLGHSYRRARRRNRPRY